MGVASFCEAIAEQKIQRTAGGDFLIKTKRTAPAPKTKWYKTNYTLKILYKIIRSP